MQAAAKVLALTGRRRHGFRSVNERFTLAGLYRRHGPQRDRAVDAIHLPNAITLPTTFGAPGTPLPAGQIVQALVLELIQSDVFRLQLPQAVVDVRTDVPLDPGQHHHGRRPRARARTRGSRSIPTVRIPRSDARGAFDIGTCRRQVSPASSRSARRSSFGRRPPRREGFGRAEDRRRRRPFAMRHRSVPRANRMRRRSRHQRRAPSRRSRRSAKRSRVAAARQTGLAPLLADVEQVVQARPSALPAPVRAAAEQVLALRVPLAANLPAPDLKQAFARSGVLFEPRLAAEARAAPRIAGRTADARRPRPRLT